MSGLVGIAAAIPTSLIAFYALLFFSYVLETHPDARYIWSLVFPFFVIGLGAFVGGSVWTRLNKRFLGAAAGGQYTSLRHIIAIACCLAADAIILIGPSQSWFPLVIDYRTPQAYVILFGPSVVLVIILGIFDALLLRYRTH